MSQQDLIQFIGQHFEAGLTQDDVRKLARRHDVSDEQYAAALLTVLSQRLTERAPGGSGPTPALLFGTAALLLLAGILFVTLLRGALAPVAGVAALLLAAGAALWGARKLQAGRR